MPSIGTSNITLTLAALCFRTRATTSLEQLATETVAARPARRRDGETACPHPGSPRVEQLHRYLHAAMQLEHATIPPYLTALYSIRPGTNADAYHVLRVVAVEEMLHLTLAANVLNAVGGDARPDAAGLRARATRRYLPDGEDDFEVEPAGASPRRRVETFLQHRAAARGADDERVAARRTAAPDAHRLAAGADDDRTMQFYSIGEFYDGDRRGLRPPARARWATRCSPATRRRRSAPSTSTPAAARSIPVTDLASALAAMRPDRRAGRGLRRRHLRRRGRARPLLPLRAARRSAATTSRATRPAPATGPPGSVDWDAVYPVKTNARLADYPAGSELHEAAVEFNRDYGRVPRRRSPRPSPARRRC